MHRWEEELSILLHRLNVHDEYQEGSAQGTRASSVNDTLPEITYIHQSKQYYGVYYRMDLIADEPQLRIGIPIDTGPWKLALYVVRLTHKQLPALFAATLNVQGNEAFRESKGPLEYHLLHGYCEMMKLLFWQGDFHTMTFPPEIHVEQLL